MINVQIKTYNDIFPIKKDIIDYVIKEAAILEEGIDNNNKIIIDFNNFERFINYIIKKKIYGYLLTIDNCIQSEILNNNKDVSLTNYKESLIYRKILNFITTKVTNFKNINYDNKILNDDFFYNNIGNYSEVLNANFNKTNLDENKYKKSNNITPSINNNIVCDNECEQKFIGFKRKFLNRKKVDNYLNENSNIVYEKK